VEPGLAERVLTGQGSTILAQRVFPILVALTLTLIAVFSTVPPNLWVVKGDLAEFVAMSYAALMIALAAFPRWEQGHMIGAPLAAFVFGGRAGGFLERAVEANDWHVDWSALIWWFGSDPSPFGMSWLFMANSLERVVLAVGMVLWHRARVSELAPLHP